MRLGVALGLLLAGGPACRDEQAPAQVAAPAGASAPAVRPAGPPSQKPPPLAAGRCCCDATLRGDQVVQIAEKEACQTRGGQCVAHERCWLPDPPQLTGK